jgi:hypothetical protein
MWQALAKATKATIQQQVLNYRENLIFIWYSNNISKMLKLTIQSDPNSPP